MSETLQLILAELERAQSKFPTWPTDPLHAVAVLGEEFGELTKSVLQLTYEPHKTSKDEVRTEAIQTAAMALRFVQSMGLYEYKAGTQHEQTVGLELPRRGFPPVPHLDVYFPPEFKYTRPWSECRVIHENTLGETKVLVVGDPDNGSYEWVVLVKGKVDSYSDCGFGISEIALRDGLNQAFKDW